MLKSMEFIFKPCHFNMPPVSCVFSWPRGEIMVQKEHEEITQSKGTERAHSGNISQREWPGRGWNAMWAGEIRGEEEGRQGTESACSGIWSATIYGDFPRKGGWLLAPAGSSSNLAACRTSVSTLWGPLEIKAIHSLSWTSSSIPTPTSYWKGKGKKL